MHKVFSITESAELRVQVDAERNVRIVVVRPISTIFEKGLAPDGTGEYAVDTCVPSAPAFA